MANDFIPTVKAPRGKGPRTKKQMKKRQRRINADARTEFVRYDDDKRKERD